MKSQRPVVSKFAECAWLVQSERPGSASSFGSVSVGWIAKSTTCAQRHIESAGKDSWADQGEWQRSGSVAGLGTCSGVPSSARDTIATEPLIPSVCQQRTRHTPAQTPAQTPLAEVTRWPLAGVGE